MHPLRWGLAAALAALALIAAPACKSGDDAPGLQPTSQPAGFMLTSPAFKHNEPIPLKHTGKGADTSPPLAWVGAPPGVKQFALTVDDPDAGKEPWDHWVIYRLPGTATSMPEGVGRGLRPAVPAGAVQGKNSWGEDNIGYRGPAPPRGKVHHYHFRLYALDSPLDLPAGIDKPALLKAMRGHILAEGEMVGTYQRK